MATLKDYEENQQGRTAIMLEEAIQRIFDRRIEFSRMYV